ncbi:MAG: NAD(P)H-dependent glycerol-3-phosphate dehydrogenase [Actinomycetota bacterium]|nr:NAD(P)-dependent glycerol-3-phosphate dehydrogenase [Actinomycetota bacterium]
MTRRGHLGVIGAGSWGTAFASILASNHLPTLLWARRNELAREINARHMNQPYLPDIPLPTTLRATANLEEAVSTASTIVIGMPSHAFRDKLVEIGPMIQPGVAVVSLTKGVEQETLFRMTEVIVDAAKIEPERAAVVSGPNLAKEVARGQPGATVVACSDMGRARRLQRLFHHRTLRVYCNDDVAGVEIAGACKNVIALAAGMADGLGYGDNSKSALITRGLAEVTRLGVRVGAKPMTFIGLAGVGDMIATCTSKLSRNRHVGEELGKGRALDEIIAEMNMVAEGVKSCRAILGLAERAGVDMPIASRVARVLFDGVHPKDMVEDLMLRAPEPEFLGIA